MLEGFLREIAAAYDHFVTGAPFGPEVGHASAVAFIYATKHQAAESRNKV